MKITVEHTLIIVALCLASFKLSAQTTPQTKTVDSLKAKVEELDKELKGIKNLTVNGWIQSQYQWTDAKGTKSYDGGDFLPNSNNRFMIRRGRVKFTYTKGITQFVLQLNATERGVNLVDFYAKATDPWSKQFALTAGVMNRPFGFEIQQSSSVRETPERSRFTQILLPNERDLGAMITYQPTKEKKLYGLKLDAGFYGGTGIAVPGTTSLNGAGIVDFDSYKDFIGHIAYVKGFKDNKYTFGIGASHYNGGYILQNNKVYDAINADVNGIKTWIVKDTSTTTYKGGKAPRVYTDVELQFSVVTPLGTTSLRGEYIFGTQSGTRTTSKSPSSLPTSMDTYERSFNGMYAYLIHRIGKSKHEIVGKLEWYDPNTKVASADFVVGTTMTEADIKYTMHGLGYNYYFHENVKFMFYYNIVRNEHAEGVSGYRGDVKDDVLTIRMQYRF